MLNHSEVVQDVLNRRGSKFVQLVKHVDEVPERKIKFPAYAQIKYDGVFCAFVVIDGDCGAYSRTGKRFTNLWKLEQYFADLVDGVYITEVVNKHMSLEELSGCVNPNRVEELDAERLELLLDSRAMVHDYLTINEFLVGKTSTKYMDRWDFAFEQSRKLGSWIAGIVQCIPCDTLEEFEKIADRAIENGHEGAVLKQDCDYEAGHKGYRCVKRVRGVHVDLECLDVMYGKGKRTGQIAALVFKYEGKEFKADLGKGWTDEKRIELTEKFELWAPDVIGKIFHVKGLQVSSKGVIRLPKVQEMRIDKDTSD